MKITNDIQVGKIFNISPEIWSTLIGPSFGVDYQISDHFILGIELDFLLNYHYTHGNKDYIIRNFNEDELIKSSTWVKDTIENHDFAFGEVQIAWCVTYKL